MYLHSMLKQNLLSKLVLHILGWKYLHFLPELATLKTSVVVSVADSRVSELAGGSLKPPATNTIGTSTSLIELAYLWGCLAFIGILGLSINTDLVVDGGRLVVGGMGLLELGMGLG